MLRDETLLFHCNIMTNELATALARIDTALRRIEAVAPQDIAPAAIDGAADLAQTRYQQLRERTQAALGELDAVIARTAAEAGR